MEMRQIVKFGILASVVFATTLFFYSWVNPAVEAHFSTSYRQVASPESPVDHSPVTPFVYDAGSFPGPHHFRLHVPMSSKIVAAVHPTSNVDVSKKRYDSPDTPTLFTQPLTSPLLISTMPPPPAAKTFTPLAQKDVDGVEKFVFFIGYPRSGHSIIGSMMDAHPDMIIAHEFMVFEKWPQQAAKLTNKAFLFNALYKDSYDDVTTGWRSSKEDKKGYTLQMKATWQGQFSRLRVIGDKSGGKVSYLYHESPETVQKSYRQLVETVQIPVHTIHVVRNPYDMIATQVLYTAAYEQSPNAPARKIAASEDRKYDNPEMLMSMSKEQFKRAEGSKNMTEACNLTVLEIYDEDFIQDPKSTMKIICEFLDLECTEEYLQLCYDKTYRSMSRTRNWVKWTPEALKYVSNQIKDYPFFHRYINTLSELHNS